MFFCDKLAKFKVAKSMQNIWQPFVTKNSRVRDLSDTKFVKPPFGMSCPKPDSCDCSIMIVTPIIQFNSFIVFCDWPIHLYTHNYINTHIKYPRSLII